MFLYGRVHWLAPVFMLAAFVLAITFALCHHFFNRHLDESTVPSAERKFLRFSKQKLYTSVGTIFPFLVKACFAYALKIVYAQLFWKSIKEQGTKLSTLDDLFSITGNPLPLRKYSLWVKYRLVLPLALFLWLIPLAVVVTPATLTVEMVPAPPSFSIIEVPMVDFGGLNFAFFDTLGKKGEGELFAYEGPTYLVTQMVTATAAQGDILAISAPHPNSSWTLDFDAPAVRCSPLQLPLREEILDQVSSSQAGLSATIAYLGWVPCNGNLPFVQGENGTMYSKGYTLGPAYLYSPGNYSSLQFPSDAMYSYTENEAWNGTAANLTTPRVFVAVIPSSLRASEDTTLISCELYNATYHTQIDFVSGAQTVTTNVTDSHNDVHALSMISWKEGVNNPYQTYHPDGSAVEVLDPDTGELSGVYNATITRTFAYQSVFDAFCKLLVGRISLDNVGKVTVTNTTIIPTVLFNTEEMSFFSTASSHSSQENMSEAFAEMGMNFIGTPKPVTDAPAKTKHLQDEIEQTFENIIINMMTSSPFQLQNFTTNVTTNSYHNIYVYAASTLWAAYGTITGLALVFVGYGLATMLLTNASFSDDLSTIVRATRHAELTIEIRRLDRDGRDPLPEYFAESVMIFPRQDAAGPGEEAMQADDAVPLMPLNGNGEHGEAAPIVANDGEEAGHDGQVRMRRGSVGSVSASLGRASGHAGSVGNG